MAMLDSLRGPPSTSTKVVSATAVLETAYPHQRISERKSRLFACACCRHVWHLLLDPRSQNAVEVAERFADGWATLEEIQAAAESGFQANLDEMVRPEPSPAAFAAFDAADTDEHGAQQAAYMVWCAIGREMGHSGDPARQFARREAMEAERASQAELLRCLFGNPFCPAVLVDDSLRAWNRDVIIHLAQAAYYERSLPQGILAPARLAVLADALEEAGAEVHLVRHLRGVGPHVRGCHVVDAILGKS